MLTTSSIYAEDTIHINESMLSVNTSPGERLNMKLVELNTQLNPNYGPGHWGYEPVTSFGKGSIGIVCSGKGFSRVCKKQSQAKSNKIPLTFDLAKN